MPNPHISRAQANTGATGTTEAMLAVAYELKTQNLLKTAEIFATPHDTDDRDDLFLAARTIMQERLS